MHQARIQARGLAALQSRKRLLVSESEINRHLLLLQAGRIREETESLRQGYGLARNAWSLWRIVAPWRRLLSPRPERPKPLWKKVLDGVSLGRRVWGVWRQSHGAN